MADVDIDPFGNHDKIDTQPDEPTSETIPLTPGGVIGGGSTWEPEHEQETSFRGKSQSTRVKEAQVEGLYRKLYEITGQTQEAFHFDDFEIKDGKLYYRDKTTPLTNKWNRLRSVGVIVEILGKEGLCDLDFDIPRGKVMA